MTAHGDDGVEAARQLQVVETLPCVVVGRVDFVEICPLRRCVALVVAFFAVVPRVVVLCPVLLFVVRWKILFSVVSVELFFVVVSIFVDVILSPCVLRLVYRALLPERRLQRLDDFVSRDVLTSYRHDGCLLI